jgi:spermidine synthase
MIKLSPRGLMLVSFFFSGASALVYQTVWMRLALARFGVNTSVVAAVLSVFMLGLALGSVLAEPLMRRAQARLGIEPLRIYGLAELAIGIGGITVPLLLDGGRRVLLAAGPEDGSLYTTGSLLAIVAALLPFCVAMGLSYPCAIAFLERAGASGPDRNPFGALYLSNVLGAVVGVLLTSIVLIETFGFLRTSLGAAVVNGSIAVMALVSFRGTKSSEPRPPTGPPTVRRSGAPDGEFRLPRAALFLTGFSTMGMEVLWTRMYPTFIGTFVYSFAAILAIYLLATTAGAAAYRRARRAAGPVIAAWWPWLCTASLIPLLSASQTLPRINGLVRVLLGLTPFCAILGFVTPALVDREGADDPGLVGRAYAINLCGCLLGPLATGFVLLPALGTRWTAFAMALPLFLLLFERSIRRHAHPLSRVAAVGLAAGVWFSTTLFEEEYPTAQVRHDHVAMVVAAGTGMDKRIFVNGVSMTSLTTVTKMMAHFPAAHLTRSTVQPFDALVICFGMGTSFRSLASWGANVTAVELVPSVTEMFGYFYPEGPRLLREQGDRLHIIHDDGRRFLDRTPERFDLITVDPPPPVEAAGSSLLYSKEFYSSAKRAMKSGAILQMWLPGGDRETVGGVANSISDSFRYVRVFGPVEGKGLHFLASESPIPRLSSEELAARVPEAAARDMTEWLPVSPASLFQAMLSREHDPESLRRMFGSMQAITDDRPVNEFFMLHGSR